MLHLVLDRVNVGLPLGEQRVQLLPVRLPECAMHGGGDADHTVPLRDLGADKLRLDHLDQELLNLVIANLNTLLDFLETYLVP